MNSVQFAEMLKATLEEGELSCFDVYDGDGIAEHVDRHRVGLITPARYNDSFIFETHAGEKFMITVEKV